MYYHMARGTREHKEPAVVLIIKLGLVLFGALIGISSGLYVGAKTLPAPHETTYYLAR